MTDNRGAYYREYVIPSISWQVKKARARRILRTVTSYLHKCLPPRQLDEAARSRELPALIIIIRSYKPLKMPLIRTMADTSMGPPSQRAITPNQDISLSVMGKLCRTTRAVLTKSPFFHYYLNNPGNRDPDGALVVNADPVLFENIL